MYLVYFKTIEDNHRCLYNDDHFETLEYLPDTKDCYHYEVFKGYDATDDGLIKFKSDMINWNNELKNNDYTVFTTYISNLTKYLPDEDVSSNMAYITNIEKSALELNESLTIYYSSDDSNKTAAWEDVITKQKKYVECENVVLEFIKTTNFK